MWLTRVVSCDAIGGGFDCVASPLAGANALADDDDDVDQTCDVCAIRLSSSVVESMAVRLPAGDKTAAVDRSTQLFCSTFETEAFFGFGWRRSDENQLTIVLPTADDVGLTVLMSSLAGGKLLRNIRVNCVANDDGGGGGDYDVADVGRC